MRGDPVTLEHIQLFPTLNFHAALIPSVPQNDVWSHTARQHTLLVSE